MAETQHSRDAGTAERALDVAEALAQTRGFNGFSYAHVAADLGITKAGLHYHFPGKSELGEALIARYSERFAQSLSELDSKSIPAPAKLEAYAGLYAAVLREGRMCLCGMLAAEHETLPESIRGAVVAFLDDNEIWLQRVLERGREDASLGY
jgi:TetR/AcrR family transcriptional repressor of nem operon